MSVKNWNAPAGLFSSASNWSPSEAPVAGDVLYIQSGAALLYNQTFGSASTQTIIGLTGEQAASPSQLVMWNVTLEHVTINNAPVPYTGPANKVPPGQYAGRHGLIMIGGVVTNDGGSIDTGRSSEPSSGNSLDIALAPQATLVNKGQIGATTSDTMNITGQDGSTLENDGTIFALGGKVTISTHLTGVGDVDADYGPNRGASIVELNAAVEAGQTFVLNRGSLQIDQPLSFFGQIKADPQQETGQVALVGLAATSWDVHGNSVEFFDSANSVIDTLRFTTPQDPAALKVYALPDRFYGSAVAVSYGYGYGPSTPASVLPYHTAAAA